MKTIMSLFLVLFVFTTNAQDSKPKNQTIEIQTSAVCEMCKDRIEKGTIKLKSNNFMIFIWLF